MVNQEKEVEARHYRIESALKIIPHNEVAVCDLPFRLDTYLGCQHNCSYCYARYNLSSHGQWTPTTPKSINPAHLEKELESSNKNRKRKSKVCRLLEKKFPLRLGTNTDCFQPIEKKKGVTKRVLEILEDWKYPYIINTKSNLVSESPYLELISNASGGAIVQYTIISLNDDIISNLEPTAPLVEKRLESIRKLANQGVHVQVRVSPIIPEVTSRERDFKTLAERAKDMGAKDLIVEFLRYNQQIKKWVLEATNGSIDLDVTYRDWGAKLRRDGRPKPDKDGYIRVPMERKFRLYSRYKEIAHELGLNLYVCSEEYPEINNCVNCCGVSEPNITNKYRGFKLYNSAATNTIACFIAEKKEVTIHDIKSNFYCVDWDKYEALWRNLEKYLVNVERREKNGEIYYVYKNRFQL